MLTEAKVVLFWAKPHSSNLIVVFVYSIYLNMPEMWSASPRVWATPSQHLAGSFNIYCQVTFHEVKVNKNWKEVCFSFLSAHCASNNVNLIDSTPTECLCKQPNDTSVKAHKTIIGTFSSSWILSVKWNGWYIGSFLCCHTCANFCSCAYWGWVANEPWLQCFNMSSCLLTFFVMAILFIFFLIRWTSVAPVSQDRFRLPTICYFPL